MTNVRTDSQPDAIMNKFVFILFAAGAWSSVVATAQPALTIYNQNFAVVRDTVPLELKSGVNEVRYPDATAQVEPDSVILRDPTGKHTLQILEQNYRNDPVTQELLLSLFEGKTIDFERMRLKDNTQMPEIDSGQNHPQRFCAGRKFGAAHHRGEWQTAIQSSRPAAVSGSGR